MAKKSNVKRLSNMRSLNRGLREIQKPPQEESVQTDEAPVNALIRTTLTGKNLPQIGIDLTSKLAPHVAQRIELVKEILENTEAETESFRRIAQLTRESLEATEATEKSMTPKN